MVSENSKVRIKFTKTGRLKFISHLDLNRMMVKFFSRGAVPVKYTEGFNPHPKVVFALPLPVGVDGLCEFFDFRVTEDIEEAELIKKFNYAFPEDIRAVEAYIPKSDFSDIGFAEYEIKVISENASPEAAEKISALCNSPLVVSKKSKSGVKDIDISKMVTLKSCEYKSGSINICAVLASAQESSLSVLIYTAAITAALPELKMEDYENDYSVCRVRLYDGNGKEFK